ncbi:MAG TPA: type II toxin-antitoxin system prevent-host-death family antitoxin [Thermotogota bacterium]|nr:type II toxin-antitoxin system prevent-host-death family antitoxin [Thermotogota bacterium]NLZ13602.1 type II toxin-antitoxin system prevent-host-death family antitoxin [Thermotogaceae bacterium]MDD8040172.1 type II toxin-antitoxin system prevent-host-death family antitoxin [Thermotogota bacterium]MDD8053559.1 type II toxin-antitoxin system prevent-host-death family antitoxin [Thermotogota bacterium]HNR62949.1 type II toxin-antitoxin system prevent-host-death family antitoxin [Thermotogota b
MRKLSDLEFYTLADAKKEFSEVIQKAKEQEIVITKNGKPAAMIVDFRRYVKVMDFLSEVYDLFLMDIGISAPGFPLEKHTLDELILNTKEDREDVEG